jgi:peptide/nickel transport system substrate-binding protein
VMKRRNFLEASVLGGSGALLSQLAYAQQTGGILPVVYSVETNAVFAPGGGGGNPLLVSTKVLERLVRLEANGSFSPQLAERWEASRDLRNFTFHLRRNATWHDGKPFTSADAVFNALSHWKAFSGNPALRNIASARALDDHTFVIGYDKPTPEFLVLASVGGSEGQVIARHVYEGTDIRTNPANASPIGTGPFRFKEWRRGSHVELVKNPAYWEAGKPYLDGIVIRYLQDPSARAAAFEAGEVLLGVGSPFSPADLQRLSNDSRFVATDAGGLQEYMVMEMNTRHPVLHDRRVRQAIAHAVNRKFVIDTLMNGFGVEASGTVAPIYRNFYNAKAPSYAYDPARAEALLDEAGFRRQGGGPRFTLKLVIGPWYPENVRMGPYLKQALEQVGVGLDLQTPDRAGAIRQIYSDNDFDLSISDNVSYADPLIRSTMVYTTENITKTPFRNASGYSNPALDNLVARASTETDAARRRALLDDVQRIASEDLPVLVVAYKRNMTIASKSVKNHSLRPEWMYDSWKDVWLQRS